MAGYIPPPKKEESEKEKERGSCWDSKRRGAVRACAGPYPGQRAASRSASATATERWRSSEREVRILMLPALWLGVLGLAVRGIRLRPCKVDSSRYCTFVLGEGVLKGRDGERSLLVSHRGAVKWESSAALGNAVTSLTELNFILWTLCCSLRSYTNVLPPPVSHLPGWK